MSVARRSAMKEITHFLVFYVVFLATVSTGLHAHTHTHTTHTHTHTHTTHTHTHTHTTHTHTHTHTTHTHTLAVQLHFICFTEVCLQEGGEG